MKKVFAILFAGTILLTGAHLSFSTHLCGGKVADVKWSFKSKLASCGMEDYSRSCPVNNEISSHCCSNTITYLKVDDNYSPTSFQNLELRESIPQVLIIPVFLLINQPIKQQALYSDIGPPNSNVSKDVSLPAICVFRI